MNGSGDILIGDITEDRFKKMSPADREWLLLSSIKSLSQTCHKRPSECNKRYVRVKHVAVIGLVMVAFLAGMGVIQIQVIIPFIVKQAVAAAMAVP